MIEDAEADSRYADYSVVRENEGVRFYAGYPILSPDGAFCMINTVPREFPEPDLVMLRSMAKVAQARLRRAV